MTLTQHLADSHLRRVRVYFATGSWRHGWVLECSMRHMKPVEWWPLYEAAKVLP